MQGYSTDGIRTDGGAYNVVLDHLSVYWATNKNFAVSGPRFDGSQRRGVAQAHLAPRYGLELHHLRGSQPLNRIGRSEHSKGALIHDNTTEILLVRNLFAHNYERSALFKGGVHAAMINNFIFDPGQRAVHYNLIAYEWVGHPFETGRITAVGNVLRAGMSTPLPLAFMELGGAGDVEYYSKDNIAVDKIGNPLPMTGRYGVTPGQDPFKLRRSRPVWPPFTPVLPGSRCGNPGAARCRRPAVGSRLSRRTARGRRR